MIFEAHEGDLLSLLTPRQRLLLAKRIVLLRELSGWGEIHLVFKDGDLVTVKVQAESLVKNEPGPVESN